MSRADMNSVICVKIVTDIKDLKRQLCNRKQERWGKNDKNQDKKYT